MTTVITICSAAVPVQQYLSVPITYVLLLSVSRVRRAGRETGTVGCLKWRG